MGKSSTHLFVLLALCACLAVTSAMRKQGVAVKGKLMCGPMPAASNSTKVRIVDIDTGPDPDDTLDEKLVDASGSFQLNGYTRELTDIGDGSTPCQRKIKMTIPKKFIVTEEPPPVTGWLDMGSINLQSTFEDEKRECIS